MHSYLPIHPALYFALLQITQHLQRKAGIGYTQGLCAMYQGVSADTAADPPPQGWERHSSVTTA